MTRTERRRQVLEDNPAVQRAVERLCQVKITPPDRHHTGHWVDVTIGEHHVFGRRFDVDTVAAARIEGLILAVEMAREMYEASRDVLVAADCAHRGLHPCELEEP